MEESVMENQKLDSTNGPSDSDGFNWQTGEEQISKYIRPATMPETHAINAERFIKQPTSEELINVTPVKRLGSIEVRKPKGQEWYRSHPSMFAEISVIRRESTGDFYAVDPVLVRELESEIREAFIAAAISYEGALFLWPIIKPKADGSGIQLFENDLADLSLSRQCWIRRQWVSGSKSYRVDQANTDKAPEWPENANISDWVKRGFRGRFIDSLDHQLVRQLRGDL
jgi:hypothetical protein